MTVSYKKWLELKVYHNYYQGGLCKGIHLVPFKQTHEKLRNYDIKIHQNSEELSFNIGTANKTDTFEALFAGLSELYFAIKTTESNFYNYTQIPGRTPNKTLFFDNENLTDETLQQDDVAGEADLINVKSRSFTVTVPESTQQVKVKDSEGDIIFSSTKISKGICVINLPKAPAGQFELIIDTNSTEKFLLLDEPADSILGVLKLSLAPVKNATEAVAYKIEFTSRSAFWQYKIGSTSTKTTIKKMAVSQGKQIVFGGPESEQLVNGQEVSVFISPQPIMFQETLQESPLLKLDYKGNFSSEVNSIDIKLPNPEPINLKSFKTEQNESHLLVSTIVYV